MESSLLSSLTSSTTTTMSILSLSKSPLISQLHPRSTLKRCIQLARFGSGFVARKPGSVDSFHKRLQFAASYSTTSFGSGNGGFGGNVGGGSGGGGGGDAAGDKIPSAVASVTGPLSSDVIILDVGGMTCGGCAASVKRILESQPQVFSANVNLTTETAIVWPVSEVKAVPNWQKDIGEALAKHLSSCGFASNLRDEGAVIEDIQS